MLLIPNQLIPLTVYQQVTDCPWTPYHSNTTPVSIFQKMSTDTSLTSTNNNYNIAMDSFRGDFVLPPKPCKPSQTASRDMGPMAKSTEYVDRFCDGDFEPSDALY